MCKLPVWSAALATCITMMTCTVIAIVPVAFRKLQLRFCRPQFSKALLKQIAASGSPAFLNTVSGRLTSIVMNVALLQIGGSAAVVIYGVMMYCADIVQPLLIGVCDTLQPAIGYNYGAGRMDRVKKMETYVLFAAAALSVIATGWMLVFPRMFAALFLQPEELELLNGTARAIRIFSLIFATRWFGFAIQSYFTAVNKPVPATVLSVGNACVLPLILMAVLWNAGLDGLWWNSALTALLISVLAGVLITNVRKNGADEQNQS